MTVIRNLIKFKKTFAMLLLDIISNVDFMHWFRFIDTVSNQYSRNESNSSLSIFFVSSTYFRGSSCSINKQRLSMLNPRLDA